MSALTETSAARAAEPGLAEANERLLVRLGFDLHDGPLQQVYALAQDIRLLREQVVALRRRASTAIPSSGASATSSRSWRSCTRTFAIWRTRSSRARCCSCRSRRRSSGS